MKIFHGIIARLHHTDRRLMVLPKRAVRRVKEGTSAVLLQSGLNESWWADSMECYTFLRNVTDLLSDGKTPYERRFGKPSKGYTLYAGGIWKGDLLIADLEELETMDASEIYSKRLNAKEVIFHQKRRIYFSNRR